MRITAGTLHTGDTTLSPGCVELENGRLLTVGPCDPHDLEFPELQIAPGFVDVHQHGGAQAAHSDADRDPGAVARVTALHHSLGTTTMVASLVTASPARLVSQVAALASAVEAGHLAGVHLEGPWLAEQYKGAHDSELLRAPSEREIDALLEAGRGTIRLATIAPELPGATVAIQRLADAGVTVAIGHTAADHAQTVAALAAGASGATHLFNAMPPIHHRSPGPIVALLDDPSVTLELIADGVHVAPALVAHLMTTYPTRIALITDAMAAAGSPDGEYRLGDLPVEVRGGIARLAGQDTIAGSTLTLDRAVANAVAWGVPLADAVRAATSIPADYLGLSAGRLQPGRPADLVLLDAQGTVQRVMRRGQWVSGPAQPAT